MKLTKEQKEMERRALAKLQKPKGQTIKQATMDEVRAIISKPVKIR